MLFFTAARNITLAYVLPGMPAAAILAGTWLAQQRRRGHAVNQLLSAGMLITLLLVCRLAIYNGEPFHMDRRSVKALVMAYDHASVNEGSLSATFLSNGQSTQSNVPLIFIGVRPFSAQFYSHGHAIQVDNFDQCWLRIGADAAYVVIPSRYGDAFIASAAAPGRIGKASSKTIAVSNPTHIVSRVYHYGNLDLFYVASR
jgi:hypothetical protein